MWGVTQGEEDFKVTVLMSMYCLCFFRSSSIDRTGVAASPVRTSGETKTPDSGVSDSSPQIHVPRGGVPVFRPALPTQTSTLPIQRTTNVDKAGNESGYAKTKEVGALEVSNVKAQISRYGTIPKGARIGAFLASLEQSQENGEDKTVLSPVKTPEDGVHTPDVETIRKVEAWRTQLETESRKSSAFKRETKDGRIISSSEHTSPEVVEDPNVKPSALLRSSSTHNMMTDLDKAALASALTRQKSDLTSSRSVESTKEVTRSPVPAARVAKPKMSPKLQQRLQAHSKDERQASKTEAVRSPPTMKSFPPRHPSSSSEEVALESKSLDFIPDPQNPGAQKVVSPPVPKKPVLPPGRESTSETDSSVDTSSVSSVVPSTARNRKIQSIREKGDQSKPVIYKKPFSPLVPEGDPLRASLDSMEKMTQTPPEGRRVLQMGTRSIPRGGARAGFTGNKPTIPGGAPAPVITNPAQLVSRTSLHKVQTTEKAAVSSTEGRPISRETLINMARDLKSNLEALSTAANKNSSNFMQLSEKVLSFHKSCADYVESLPPHGKFHFKELLNSLQAVAESLKMCSGSNMAEYDKVLADLQKAVKDIETVIDRRDKV